MDSHDLFSSAFTWRYGSTAMRRIWSENHKRRLWRKIWVALATAQSEAGLVTPEQVQDLERYVDQVSVARSLEIEADVQHDLMAEIKAYAEQCSIGGAIIHLGATSADIEDNADVLRIRESLQLNLASLENLLLTFCEQIETFAETPTMGYTHLQPAEPTTIGYRLSQYAQDIYQDYRLLNDFVKVSLRGKGMKGAVGTQASYKDLLFNTSISASELEKRVMEKLGLGYYPVSSQTYPRKQDWLVLVALAGLAASLHKFAFDMRLLQSPLSGEFQEQFSSSQIGSSAMPFKRNPIRSEKINSLARLVAGLPQVAWMNAGQSLLERTLDDSANRREILPIGFLAVDEMLLVASHIVKNLNFDTDVANKNLERFVVFSAIERILLAAVIGGADRQDMHEFLRIECLAAWDQIQAGYSNPLRERLLDSAELGQFLSSEQITRLLAVESYYGEAARMSKKFVAHVRHVVVNKDNIHAPRTY